MKVFIFSIFFTTYLFQAAMAKHHREKNNKPNIIVIMADDFSYEYLSLYQDKVARTPNLDKMGRKGLQFTEFHVAPLCTPTRNRIMTGKNNYKTYLGFGMLDP